MKHLHTIILMGLMVHFLPLHAEDNEEAPLTALDEELFLLDEEFEAFREELSSLQDAAGMTTPLVAETSQEVALEKVLLTSDGVLESLPPIETAIEPLETPGTFIMQMTAAKEEVTPISKMEESPIALTVTREVAIEEAAPTQVSPSFKGQSVTIDLEQAFAGSPAIYLILLGMSVISVSIWLYSILSLRHLVSVRRPLLDNIQNRLTSNHFEEALTLCREDNSLFSRMVSNGILSRKHGLPVMIEAMKAEGKRSSIGFWQKIGLLNDIAIIAPMLGLLGTVLGMFYAFYDVNRSIESISTLFDGLGVSVGTTVAGLIVAILSLILHSTAKYRLVRALTVVEGQAHDMAILIDDRTSIFKG